VSDAAAVDAWFARLLVGADDPVAEGDVPPHGVSPLQGRLLELLVRIAGARRVLELGTLAGYSAAWLARALPPGGRLVTLEADPAYAEIARANLAGLPVDVVAGPALETLPAVEGPFDLIFIDADKRSNPEYLGWALRLSRPGTVIVADNVVREGAVLDGDDPSARGVREFAELVAAEPRLTATAVQTVGEKGWDGFLLALVGDD
jgi:predicted O-methyltransferase YrrM